MATRACSWCGKPHTPERWKIGHSYCKPAHRQAAHHARRYPGEDMFSGKPQHFKPRSLYFARLALEKGVPFDQLVLDGDARDVMLVAHPRRFAGELRQQAAERLMSVGGRYGKVGRTLALDALDRFDLLEGAVEAAWETDATFGSYKPDGRGGVMRRGRPFKVAPYIPAESFFEVMLFDWLYRELGRRAEQLQHEASASQRPDLGREIAEPTIRDGVYVEDGDQPITSTRRPGILRQPESEQTRRAMTAWKSRRERAQEKKEIQAELHGIHTSVGVVRPEPFYDRKGEIPDWMNEYRQARWLHYLLLRGRPVPWGYRTETGEPVYRQADTGEGKARMLETIAAQNEEILARIQAMQERLEIALDGIGETAERIRERFPNDAEVSATVDRFLNEIGPPD